MRLSENVIFNQIPYFLQKTAGKKLHALAHNHDFYEIVIVLSGSCCHLIDGEQHVMEITDGVFLHPDNTHCLLSQSDDADLLVLSVTFSEMKQFLDTYGIADDFMIQHCPLFFNSVPISLLNTQFADEPSLVLLRILLGQILHEILLHQNCMTCDPMPPKLKATLDKLSNPEFFSIDVNSLVTLSCYSYSHLFRLMKQYTGKTPHAYLNDLKMKQAYLLLDISLKGIEEISELLGFSSYSHFCKTFKKYYGMTPAQSRKKQNHPISTV